MNRYKGDFQLYPVGNHKMEYTHSYNHLMHRSIGYFQVCTGADRLLDKAYHIACLAGGCWAVCWEQNEDPSQ